MDASFPECLVNIYVAQAGNKRLVKEQGFHLSLFSLEHVQQAFLGKTSFKGFGADFIKDAVRRPGQGESAELAGVLETQFVGLIHLQHHVLVFAALGTRWGPGQASGHAQVDQQCPALGKVYDNVLSPSCKSFDAEPFNLFAEPGGGHAGNGPGPVDTGVGDGAPTDAQGIQVVHHGLYFR